MVNNIWFFFIVSGTLYSLLTGNIDIINKEIISSVQSAFKLTCNLFPIIALWLGIMNIAKTSKLLDKLSLKLSKILHFIFPDIPRGHESLGYISSNIIANFFGLGSAATPFGLKAMESLQSLNNKKDEASRSMITFLVLNTSGLTIIPTTIISLRMMHKSSNPTEIVFACIIATTISTIAGLIADRILYRVSKK